ncbi:MAG: hypothetical protein JWM74_1917 [Myxococcaceae bacterium]|nr:hypothetical protein [Myxococcaceae bacterium]
MVKRVGSALLVAAVVVACRPDLEAPLSLLGSPRVLAVSADPAEALPGARVTLRALVADRSGELEHAPITWAFCTDRKPLAELGPVSPRCVASNVDPAVLAPIDVGPPVTGAIPIDACRRFGPDVPPSAPGEPAGRPVDADVTGGFFQPVRLVVSASATELIAVERTRVTCGLGASTQDQLVEFRQRYRPNVNPALDGVARGRGSAFEALRADVGAEPNLVAAGERLVLRASWAHCSAPGCTGREPYVVFDRDTLIDKVETMRVSWFATDGAFDEDRTGSREGEPDTSDNTWTSPAKPGITHLFVVLRDDRGGVGWTRFQIEVR